MCIDQQHDKNALFQVGRVYELFFFVDLQQYIYYLLYTSSAGTAGCCPGILLFSHIIIIYACHPTICSMMTKASTLIIQTIPDRRILGIYGNPYLQYVLISVLHLRHNILLLSRTAVPFWGETTQIPTIDSLSAKPDCGPKRVLISYTLYMFLQ